MKLSVPDGFTMPPLDRIAGVQAIDRGVHVLEATYWDTPRMQLYRAGLGLRYRTADSRSGTWTLKGNSRREGSTVVRTEIDVPGPPSAPPPDVVDLLPGDISRSALGPVASLRTQRHVIDLLDEAGDRWAEIDDDRVAVLRERQVVETFREVELELTGADGGGRADAVVRLLEEAGARDSGGQGKHSRALQALGVLPTGG